MRRRRRLGTGAASELTLALALVDLDRLFRLFGEARRLCKHNDYVVMGSNSVMAFAAHTRIPPEMTLSLDVDAYTKADPGRVFDLLEQLGENSAFRDREGFFLDGVSPELPTLPLNWQSRLIPLERKGVTIWFLEPNDAAISKYARGEPRDQRWIRAGVKSGIVSLPVIQQRVADTCFADDAERDRAHEQIKVDLAWFATLKRTRGSAR